MAKQIYKVRVETTFIKTFTVSAVTEDQALIKVDELIGEPDSYSASDFVVSSMEVSPL